MATNNDTRSHTTPEHLGPEATDNDVEAWNWLLDNTELTEDELWNNGDWVPVASRYLPACTECGAWILVESWGCPNECEAGDGN